MTTILIVGAGLGQLPAIRTAREMGLRVVAIDRDARAPGMQYAQVALPIDVTDREAAVGAAREHNVEGALTLQSDLPVPTVGAVVDALGLVGQGLDVAERCSNKIAARRRLRANDVPQPAYEVVSSAAEVEEAVRRIGLPCVVKAPDSSGSRGVVRIDDISSASDAYHEAASFSREGRVLIESFIEGVEIGAQAFSTRGSCEAVWIHDDEVAAPPYMVPIGHWYPSETPHRIRERIQEVVAQAVDVLGITDGPSNIDVIVREDGTPMILEVGARMGATCLPELTSHHTGIDWVRSAILTALGSTPDLRAKALRSCAAFILEAPDDGRLRNWSPPAGIDTDPRVLEWEVTASPNDCVSKLRKGSDRIGKVLVEGATGADAAHHARELRAQFLFEVDKAPW